MVELTYRMRSGGHSLSTAGSLVNGGPT
jgi:hypothetical protein